MPCTCGARGGRPHPCWAADLISRAACVVPPSVAHEASQPPLSFDRQCAITPASLQGVPETEEARQRAKGCESGARCLAQHCMLDQVASRSLGMPVCVGSFALPIRARSFARLFHGPTDEEAIFRSLQTGRMKPGVRRGGALPAGADRRCNKDDPLGHFHSHDCGCLWLLPTWMQEERPNVSADQLARSLFALAMGVGQQHYRMMLRQQRAWQQQPLPAGKVPPVLPPPCRCASSERQAIETVTCLLQRVTAGRQAALC